MILSATTLRQLRPVDPFCERTEYAGMTYGLGPAGYDVRVEFDSKGVRKKLLLGAGGFCLVSTIERFTMPPDVLGIVHDKSSWARKGLTVQNTVIEPGWFGYLTLELTNHTNYALIVPRGVGIAQVVFHRVDDATRYTGKYQNQDRGPQEAK
jgi:dCTP deaminase